MCHMVLMFQKRGKKGMICYLKSVQKQAKLMSIFMSCSMYMYIMTGMEWSTELSNRATKEDYSNQSKQYFIYQILVFVVASLREEL